MVVWVAISFLVRLPIDESKVYPALTPSRIASSSIWIAGSHPNEDGIWISDVSASHVSYHLPGVDDENQVMVIRNSYTTPQPTEETQISLEQYPHTRRCLSRMLEEGFIHTMDDSTEVYQVAGDPFVHTRIAIRSSVAQIRARLLR